MKALFMQLAKEIFPFVSAKYKQFVCAHLELITTQSVIKKHCPHSDFVIRCRSMETTSGDLTTEADQQPGQRPCPSYRLWYFNLRGRAETIRLIFAQAGVAYEDFRFSREEWPELKPKMPWNTVPVLETGGKLLGQSGAICRYLASEFGLAGNSRLDEAIADSIGETITDIREKYSTAFSESDEQKKSELKKIYREKILPPILDGLEKALGDQMFFLGNKVTWPDLHFYACLELVQVAECPTEEALSKHPKLLALFNRVKQLPNIALWLERRPSTDF